MNIEDVISFNEKEFVILDIVLYNNEKYLYCAEIDSNEEPTHEYAYFKGIEENGEYFVEDIDDDNILNEVISMFAANVIDECTNEEQDV